MAIDFNQDNLEELMAQLRRQGFTSAQAGYIAGIPVAQRGQAYDAFVNEMVPKVGAVDVANLQNQRDMARLQYQQGLAGVNYQRGNAQQNYGISRDNLVRQLDAMRQNLPYQFNNRGLMNSGLYKQGLSDYADSRVRTLNQFDTQHSQNMAGFGLQQQNVEGLWKTQQENIKRAEEARRAQTAAQIKAVQ